MLSVVKSVKRFSFGPLLAVVGMLAFGSASFASGTAVTIPDLGVDTSGLATTAATNMGTILGILFGLFVLLVIFGAGWKWARRAIKGG